MAHHKQKIYSFKNYNCEIVHNFDELNTFIEKNRYISSFCCELNEKNLKRSIKEGKINGWCCACDQEAEFVWKVRPKYSEQIMFTEVLWHTKCHMTNRQRAMIHLFKIFEKNHPKNKKIYLYEQTTTFYENFKNWFGQDNKIIGSEFMGYDKKPGEIVDGIRHEDSTNLSFEDNELDYIISNDVFEHVPDIEKTLSEAKRCLKQQGKLIFRIPVEWYRAKTFKRAKFKDHEIEYLAEKILHGGFQYDGSEGSLLVYNFGKDIFEIIKNASFQNSYGVAIWDKKYANIDYWPIVIFVCEK